jgi:hypothetical protein
VAELGSDIAGVFDIGPTLGTVTGRQALAEAILRRLAQPRGSLIGDETYGYLLLGTIGSAVIPSRVEQLVLEQVTAEEEVEDARCEVTFNGETSVLTVSIEIEDGDGPFTLTVTSSALRIQALLDGYLFLDEEPRGETTTVFTDT